jgi:hypothetical protein
MNLCRSCVQKIYGAKVEAVGNCKPGLQKCVHSLTTGKLMKMSGELIILV